MTDFTILTTPTCAYCKNTKKRLTDRGFTYTEIDITQSEAEKAKFFALCDSKGIRRTVPQVFRGDLHIGGDSDLAEYLKTV